MLNWLRKRKENNQGFTLVELIIVIAILAILIGLLAPQYIKYVEKSRQSTDASNLERLVEAVKVASADTDYNIPAGKYTIKITSSQTTITPEALTGSGSSAPNTTNLVAALKEYSGYDFSTGNKTDKLKLKSNRWDKFETSHSTNDISATITIDTDSSVTVTYAPSDIKDLTKN